MPGDAGFPPHATRGELDTMHTAYRSPAITLTSQSSADLHADLLILPYFVSDDFGD
jgi:hypothetical protein